MGFFVCCVLEKAIFCYKNGTIRYHFTRFVVPYGTIFNYSSPEIAKNAILEEVYSIAKIFMWFALLRLRRLCIARPAGLSSS